MQRYRYDLIRGSVVNSKRTWRRTFIENLYGKLVPIADASNNVLLWDSKIIKVESARRACPDAQLLFLLRNLYTHILCRYEACNAFVPFAVIYVGEYKEDFGLIAVRYPPKDT